ncbi:unnamed protein product [Lactuca virosa]|uniref:Uncharacterized protein n=1 Tax=Lactuca virosa TaxID=75947 RepID=A0AAU9MXA5_9ASTR|nr:unnamed protein product [Lactuca virosa]
MRVRKDRTEIKVEKARKDSNRLRAENDAKDPPCSCWHDLAAPRCIEWLLHSVFPNNARTGTHVLARSVLLKANRERVVAVVGLGGWTGGAGGSRRGGELVDVRFPGMKGNGENRCATSVVGWRGKRIGKGTAAGDGEVAMTGGGSRRHRWWQGGLLRRQQKVGDWLLCSLWTGVTRGEGLVRRVKGL